MISYIEHYGADTNSNRCVCRRIYKLEPSDKDMILDYIHNNYEAPYKGKYQVVMSDYDEIVAFDVMYEDWINK